MYISLSLKPAEHCCGGGLVGGGGLCAVISFGEGSLVSCRLQPHSLLQFFCLFSMHMKTPKKKKKLTLTACDSFVLFGSTPPLPFPLQLYRSLCGKAFFKTAVRMHFNKPASRASSHAIRVSKMHLLLPPFPLYTTLHSFTECSKLRVCFFRAV